MSSDDLVRGPVALKAISTVTPAADKLPYYTSGTAAGVTDFTAFGRTLAALADASAGRTALGLVIGTNVQAYDADLTSWAAITRATGFDTFVATPSSANLDTLVTDDTGSGSLVFATSPTLVTPVLGAATGTSLTLSSLTSGRVTYATTSGLLTDSAAFLFDGSKAQLGTSSATRLLLGTATDSSNGALQLAAHTTSAGGIGFGADTNIYRGAAGILFSTASQASTVTGIQAQNQSTTGYTSFRAYNNLGTFGASAYAVDLGVGGSAVGAPYQGYGYIFTGASLTGFRIITNNGGTAITVDNSQNVALASSTASTSTTTGSLTTAGGLGVAGAVWAGTLNLADNTALNLGTSGGNSYIRHNTPTISGIEFAAGGSARAYITDNGNVLVGTTSESGLSGSGALKLASTTEATTGGAGSLTTAGGIYAAKNVVTAQTFIGGVQSLSGAGAVNVTTLTTEYTSTGAAQALTLANGSAGQIKIIVHGVDGGSGVLTPTTKTGYTTITFTNVGESVTLQYFTTRGWIIVALYGAVAA